MSDAQITEESGTEAEVPDQPPTPAESDEADDTADDHLAPVRVASLPPVPRPPPSKRISVPPPLHSVPASVAANGVAAAGSARGGRPAMPSAMAAERLSRRLLAGVCLVVALALGVSGLVVGLSAPSSDLGPASSVLAAVVVARALMGVGMLGAGLVFLRMGERWFTLELGKLDPGGPDSRDSDR